MLASDSKINIDPVKTGQKMKEFRKKKGLSVKDVTKALGLQAPQSVYKWERGDCLPRVDNFFSLCCLYEVTPLELCAFYDTDNEDYFRSFFQVLRKVS